MFTDMKLSADTMESFKAYIRNMEGSVLDGIDLNVFVLTTGFWPTQTAANCNLPTEILKCCEVFKKFYLSNHNGRRISWQTNMGSAELKAQFSKKQLNVSTYQMVILLMFNDRSDLSYKEIQEASGIPFADLKKKSSISIFSKI